MPDAASAPTSSQPTSEERRAFDRLVNFTDAVVAIGITLQLLPLIDVAGPAAGETVWDVIAANQGQITAFVLSFGVVIAMWATHNRVFNVMHRYDGTIFILNGLWLILIVFLPWPTSMYGNAVNDQVVGSGGVGLLYWWTLAAISGLGSLIALHAWRSARLLEPGAYERHRSHRTASQLTGLTFFLAFVGIGVFSEFLPSLAPYLAFLLFPINAALSRWGSSRDEQASDVETQSRSQE